MPDNFSSSIASEMGNGKSKRKDKPSRVKAMFSGNGYDPRDADAATKNGDFSLEIRERWAEDFELNIMRRTIETNPEHFILNNLMMSCQFFENYDEEISTIRQTLVSSKEAELNARLPLQKHTLIPDVLQQHVAKNVDFTYMLPNLKHTIELLQPIRIYVVFDNIEVTEDSHPSPYWTVNETITYSMQLKPSSKYKGYVQLQRLEVNMPKKTTSSDDLGLPSIVHGTRDEIDSDNDSTYGDKSNGNCINGIHRIMKNSRDTNDPDYDDHRYGSQTSVFQFPVRDEAKEENAYGPSIDRTIDRRDDGKTGPRRNLDGRPDGPNSQKPYRRPKVPLLANENRADSTSSGYRSGNYMDTDSDSYSYAQTIYSNAASTSKSSSIDNGTRPISCTEIPRQCFKKMEYRADGKIYDARRERRQKLTLKEQLIMQAHQSRNYDVWYLNSAKFMKYFCQIFTDHLAVPMGFNPEINESAQGSVIYRDRIELLDGTMSTKVETFEIVPCISSQWPECAQEWLDRPRISWPDCEVIRKIKEFGCHMIPEGFMTDKAYGKYQDLEWQLIFPAAERFLETCMTHSQVRVYLISLMLHKTFIRPVDSIFGLTTSHIKNRLFWLIEQDDRAGRWMEHRAGESLMRLLNSLYRSISQDEPNLADFFIKDKNLFQEKSYLLRTQKQLKRIIENPVMYVFHAMENIRHSRRFFPRLDYEELLRILTADTLTLVNPALAQQKNRTVGSANSAEKDYDRVGGFWDNVKEKKSEGPKIYPKKQVTNLSMINPRKAYDQVVEIPIRCASLEPRRLSRLLDFFIKHFIKMAESCHKYRAVPQKTAYIEQAERLSVLLSEHSSHKEIAKVYLEQLCSLKRRTINSRLPSDPPQTPKRNPDMPIFKVPLKNRYQSPEYSEENRDAKSEDLKINTERPVNSITKVVIHEEEEVHCDNVEIHSFDNGGSDKSATIKESDDHVLSLTEKREDSFLTETTYI